MAQPFRFHVSETEENKMNFLKNWLIVEENEKIEKLERSSYIIDGTFDSDARKISNFKLSNNDSMIENFSVVDTFEDYETHQRIIINIRLGCFTEWKNEYVLEEEFDTMLEMVESLKIYTLDEIEDMILAPYVEVIRKNWDKYHFYPN